MSPTETRVEVTRGDLAESMHEIAACAVDAKGQVVLAAGNIDKPVYLRSTAKPFIAAAAIAAGVREQFELERHEIAVMAGSHSGEPFHIGAVRAILYKIGMTEDALQCGAHEPYNADAAAELRSAGLPATAIYNNCSGKHAGILALCKAIGANTATYLQPNNPAQQQILAFCAGVSDARLEDLPVGVDGCGIPVYAAPLRNVAISYMRLATLSGMDEQHTSALHIVRDAMIAYPEYGSGTGEFDAALMAAGAGSIACKGGAEGVHGDALIGPGIGMALKVLDGAERASAPAVIAILQRLGALSQSQMELLEPFSRPILHNRAGLEVGQITTVQEA
ncbi:MAG: asparaginase [Candidatus Eremiobacteraeota bacterium]|nr:asparaginase [Candidatus Eremiobacteraeota bacterium]